MLILIEFENDPAVDAVPAPECGSVEVSVRCLQHRPERLLPPLPQGNMYDQRISPEVDILHIVPHPLLFPPVLAVP